MKALDLARAPSLFPIGPQSGWVWVYRDARWRLYPCYDHTTGHYAANETPQVPVSRQQQLIAALPRLLWPPPLPHPFPFKDAHGTLFVVRDGELRSASAKGPLAEWEWIACDGHTFLRLMGAVLG